MTLPSLRVVLGDDWPPHPNSGTDATMARMVAAARRLGGLAHAALTEQEGFRPFGTRVPTVVSSDLTKRIRQRIAGIRQRLPARWCDTVHRAIIDYARLLGQFPQALRQLMHLLYFEPLLYNEPAGKWYKDHLVHQLRVTRTSFQLIDAARRTGSLPASLDPLDLEASALLAGLFHDVGYPLTFLDRLHNHEDMTHWDVSLRFPLERCRQTLARSRIAQTLTALDLTSDPFLWVQGWIERHSSKVHGILSGLWLLGLRDEVACWCGFAGSHPPREARPHSHRLDGIFEDAASAAFFHHFPEMTESPPVLSLREHPLAAILQVADGVQEWGRPIVVQTLDGHIDFEIPNDYLVVERRQGSSPPYTVSPLFSPNAPTPTREDWQHWLHGDPAAPGSKSKIPLTRRPRLRVAGWDPTFPFDKIPEALARLDPAAVNLLFHMDLGVPSTRRRRSGSARATGCDGSGTSTRPNARPPGVPRRRDVHPSASDWRCRAFVDVAPVRRPEGGQAPPLR